MARKESNIRQDQSSVISRRRLLSTAGSASAALGLVAFGVKPVSSENYEDQRTTDNRTSLALKDLPSELTQAHPELSGILARELKVEGESIVDTLADGPKAYKISAVNGQRIETVARELDQASYVRSDLYDVQGNPVVFNMDTRVVKTLFKTGDYYLVISSEGNAPAGRFELNATDPREHGVQTTFFQDYSLANVGEFRYDPETLPILSDGKTSVVLNFFPDSGYYNPTEVYTDKIQIDDIKVYVKPGTPQDLRGRVDDLPEMDPKNEIYGANYGVNTRHFSDHDGRNTRLVQKIITNYYVNYSNGEAGFLTGSHVAVTVKNPRSKSYETVSRFFIV